MSANAELNRWPFAAALALSMFLTVGVGFAEEDHLKGYLIKDLNQIPGLEDVPVTTRFGNEICDLKKARFLLVQSEKAGEDDPRGGPAGDFVCYKARCSGPLPPTAAADTQFGVHQLEAKKAKLVCLPVDESVCGDGELDPGETCDGTSADDACPGLCASDCACTPCGGMSVGVCPHPEQTCTLFPFGYACTSGSCGPSLPSCSGPCLPGEVCVPGGITCACIGG